MRVASREYAFVDEWDVAAPPDAVFRAIADARTYPVWWRPVYLGVDADGEPRVGKQSHQHFKGRLPYHLHTRSRITRLEPPDVIAAEVDGDLRGHGQWTLTETAAGTHVRFDWHVSADRPLLRALSPVLRPALRWNHAWAIARAREGLEPFARSVAAVARRNVNCGWVGSVSVPAARCRNRTMRVVRAYGWRVLHRWASSKRDTRGRSRRC